MFSGPCALKYRVDTSNPAMPVFTPVAGPKPTEQLFFGPQSPNLSGKTIRDVFFSFDVPNTVYLYTLIVRKCCT